VIEILGYTCSTKFRLCACVSFVMIRITDFNLNDKSNERCTYFPELGPRPAQKHPDFYVERGRLKALHLNHSVYFRDLQK
jgi:hypothetical protein